MIAGVIICDTLLERSAIAGMLWMEAPQVLAQALFDRLYRRWPANECDSVFGFDLEAAVKIHTMTDSALIFDHDVPLLPLLRG